MRNLEIAITDIHGRSDLLFSLLNKVKDYVGDDNCMFIFCGDYVDRGPDSKEVLDFLMASRDHANVYCLKGNHEDMMVDAYDDEDRNGWHWYGNGGRTTIQSFGVPSVRQIPNSYIEWCRSLRTILATKHRYYVHAGLHPAFPVDKQPDEQLMWIRDPFLTLRKPPVHFDKHIVHGHTPFWPGKVDSEPELKEWRTNLDTGAFKTGVLSAGIFDNAIPGGPIEVLHT